MSRAGGSRPQGRQPYTAALQAKFNQALALHQQGKLADAERLYEEVLQRLPNHFDALHRLGILAVQTGRTERGVQLIRKAISLNANVASAHVNLGYALKELKRPEQALAHCNKAIALKPDLVEAHSNRGDVLLDLKRPVEALASHDKAIALKPDYAQAYYNSGLVLQYLNRTTEALARFDKAITLKRDFAEAYNDRGLVLQDLRRLDEALASHDSAIALKPDFAAAYINRGNALLDLKRPAQAFESFEKAIELKPDFADAYNNRGLALLELNRPAEALASFDKAIAVKPDFGFAISNKIFALDFMKQFSFAEHWTARDEWWQRVGSKIALTASPKAPRDRDPARRIVLGYVSGDLRQHSAGYAFRPLLENHDRSRFEIVCYSNSFIEDDVTGEFQQIAHRWRNILRVSDDDVAAQIHNDGIDILIDLSTHTRGHRLEVFARKPAPIQATWSLGTGVQTIDYLLTDPILVPAECSRFFAEKICYLPCAVPTAALSGDSAALGEPRSSSTGHVTFGIFNRPEKFSNDAIRLWSRILAAIPDARLVLKASGLELASRSEPIAKAFADHDVAVDRLTFLGSTPRVQHLKAYQGVDISLDPFPANGGVSTWESLLMGVPVVCMLGTWISSRVSASIMSAIGLRDWVAENEEEYLAIACKYASVSQHLRQLRRSLPDLIAASPAGNVSAYTRAVEDAYQSMWQDYCRMP